MMRPPALQKEREHGFFEVTDFDIYFPKAVHILTATACNKTFYVGGRDNYFML